jgi:hypothetical protein
MVKVRHGFAHQDQSNAPPSTAGIVSLTPSGNLSLQSHHAFNSMSLVVQAAIQMVHGLTNHLICPAGPMRWKKAMTGADWERCSVILRWPATLWLVGRVTRGNGFPRDHRSDWLRPRLGELAKAHTALAQVAATALNCDGNEWVEVAGRRFSTTEPESPA